MRFLKIFLMIFTLIILLVIFYLIYDGFTKGNFWDNPLLALVNFPLAIIFFSVNICYHFKTFHFYRRKEKRNLDKKVSKFLWAGAICFSLFFVWLLVSSTYVKLERFTLDNYDPMDMLFSIVFCIPALLNILEVSILKKRLKRLKIEHDTKEEISDIGNSIS